MKLFDMHCDTLYRAFTENSTLYDDSFHISFGKAGCIHPYIQCLAVWIPDEYRDEKAWELFVSCRELLKSQLEGKDIVWCKTAEDISAAAESGRQGIILTVESGAVIGNDLGKIQLLHDMGVRMMTLTWNGSNALGDGIGAASDRGLTAFGKEAVREMERVGIIVDVSHAGEKLFDDVFSIATKPFAASHSNVRSVAPHKRNLTDDQFRRLVGVGGLSGLNFCAEFLNKCKTKAGMYDIIKHTEHMISLGGAENIAFGADLDGAEIPEDIRGIESMGEIWHMFEEHFGSELCSKLFFDNALGFFSRYMG